jgi:nucleotide-binding universal stress UspA family protein
MARPRDFKVLVATDGTAHGRAAVAAAVAFPWPARAIVQGVVARSLPTLRGRWSARLRAAAREGVDRAAAQAQRTLRGRWPTAVVVALDKPPVEAILAEARGARAIVVGTRGHGALARLVLGSVSRGVVRRGYSSTLVVKGRPRPVRHLLIGLDGSANARRAIEFVAELRPPRGGRVTLVRVLEPVRVGSLGLMPAGVRGMLERELTAVRSQQTRAARRDLAAASVVLKRAGWRARSAIRWGIPADELFAAGRRTGAHVLVVGARGTGGVARLLLGSVAESALSHARLSVLVVC